ncbi:MAG: SufD family Fe-S cluster assembly protein, partial [Candidatus Aenigmarchaeota archaeon]|nr:SufD family Fe-S cluster assembly protein [Candidatus Aenigmarchaeota archaeon]
MQDIVISRERFDHSNPERMAFKAPPGLSREIVEHISDEKDEPGWMLEKRLKGLEIFNKLPMPDWGPDLSSLDLDKITFFAKPDAKKNARSWDDVPEDIKKTFERLGIPEAEKKALAGVGAQYESMNIYHNLKKELADQGVVFLDMDEGLSQYPELVKKYFMTTCVPIGLHKFSALHAAVWSGGTFIYVPEGVKVPLPLQAYFRMNAEKMGQFEHTLIIVDKGAQVQYIEGCFTKGSTITANPEYKPIEEVKVGDKVLTHTGGYKNVYHTQVRPYTGDLYKIQIYGDSTAAIEVTEEHPFLGVKRQRKRDRNKRWERMWLIPKELSKLDYLAMPINKVVASNPSRIFAIKKGSGRRKQAIIQKEVPLTKEFFRLVGYYLAEGSIMKDSYLSFSFGSHEREYIEDVKRLLKNVFGTEKLNEIVHKKNNGTSVVVGSVELARIFKEFGRSAENKGLPQWIMLEDPEKQKELIVGLFRGDGNYYKKKHQSGFKEVFRINTTSEKLARQAREILFRLKIPAFLNRRIRQKPRIPIYTIGVTGEFVKDFGSLVGVRAEDTINGKRRASMFYVDRDYVYVPIKRISKKSVANIPVYNFSVEGDESYVAGGVAVHNCSAPQYASSSLHAGCVEVHVLEGARARYSSVENWSRNTYNLNTKRASVHKNGIVEWINGNMGCLTGDAKVYTNPEGPVNISRIKPGTAVFALDEKNKKFVKARVKQMIYSGEKKVYRLQVAGREIKASANHPFLVIRHEQVSGNKRKGRFITKWAPLDELKEGDVIAISKALPDT